MVGAGLSTVGPGLPTVGAWFSMAAMADEYQYRGEKWYETGDK